MVRNVLQESGSRRSIAGHDQDQDPAPPYEPSPSFPNSLATTSRSSITSLSTIGDNGTSTGVLMHHSHSNSIDTPVNIDINGFGNGNSNSQINISNANNENQSIHAGNASRNHLSDHSKVEDSNILFGVMSKATYNLNKQRRKLKILGLRRLNATQNLIIALCRDVSLIVIIKYLYILLKEYYHLINDYDDYNSITSVRASEIFMAAVWCIVSGYLSYSVLDDLMLRWIVMYDIPAVIIRMLSMSLFIIFLIELLLFIISNENQMNEFFYSLPAWITISCVLTLVFIIQNFVTSNLPIDESLLKELDSNDKVLTASNNNSVNGIINEPSSSHTASPSISGPSQHTLGQFEATDLHYSDSMISMEVQPHVAPPNTQTKKTKTPRSVDLYNITVFAVVPIGIASFITMIVLIRLVIILRLDIDFNKKHLVA